MSTLPLLSEATADTHFDALQREADQIQRHAESLDQLAEWARVAWERILKPGFRRGVATEGAVFQCLRRDEDAKHLIGALGEGTCHEIIASTRDGAMATVIADEAAREAKAADAKARAERYSEAARAERERKSVEILPLLEHHRARFADCEIEQPYEFQDLQRARLVIENNAAEYPNTDPIVRPWLTRAGFERDMLHDFTIDGEPIYTEDQHAMLREHYAGETAYESDADTERTWFLIRDNGERGPASIDDPKAWAEGWRSRLPPSLRDAGMISVLRPGAPVEALVWCNEPISGAAVWGIIQGMNGPHAEDEGDARFVALERWQPFGTPVLLEPRVSAPKTATLASMRARIQADTIASGVIRTGIAGLDSQLRVGGIPVGSLVIVQGGPKECKTTTEIEIACAAREQGYHAAFIAGDESPAEIHARLWQRQGVDPVEARQRALRGEYADDGFLVIDPREHALEAILAAVRAETLPTVLVVESIQKLARGGQHEIDALLGALRATGKTTIAASEVVGTARGGRRSKGSTGIGYEAHLTLDVTRRGSEVTIQPTLNRLGTEEPVRLRLDAARQTLTAIGTAVPVDEAEGGVRGAVLAALADQPRSKTWLRDHIQGWRSERVLETVEALDSEGRIEKRGTKYVIHGAP